jgi:2',3'-cyclic-nucleotide 2'-phosphodiesterase (5'-nucleotidase family)
MSQEHRIARLCRPLLVALAVVLLPGSARAADAPPRPKSLVVLSTCDLKGKTSPCGCHVPKGGLARMASFADSVRMTYDDVVLVNNGFFPEEDGLESTAVFLMDAMNTLGTDAMGISEKELRYGRSFLLASATRTRAPLVCANLLERATGRPLVAPYVIKRVGGTSVGIFGLTGPEADLGPSRDSLQVEDPTAAAKRTVDELRAKGATVIVLLSQIGQFPSEDLVTAVDGIDVLISGHGIPVLKQGRQIKQTVACYGGEQGQYMGRTIVQLDARNRMAKGSCETFMLSAEVGEKATVLALVRGFEEKANHDRLERERRNPAP